MGEQSFDLLSYSETSGIRGPGVLVDAARYQHAMLFSRRNVLMRQAIEMQSEPETNAIAIVQGEACKPDDLLALDFARILREARTGNSALRPTACLTSVQKPRVMESFRRIPHFVPIVESFHVQDRIIWEVQSPEQTESWYGGELPDEADMVERHLHEICNLRRLTREGVIYDYDRYAPLREVLEPDQTISIRFVYRHLDLIRSMIEAED